MPTRHQPQRWALKNSSIASSSNGTQIISPRLLRCPGKICKNIGPQNISEAAATRQATGCSPRREVQRYMKSPARKTCNAISQFVAGPRGNTRYSQLGG